ncbi:MAG TPA: alpha/beta fold hydrolase [Pseudomonadota bacterium]|nr:alpha/beta fold hydrolase [Pseudomonadota bacterium]
MSAAPARQPGKLSPGRRAGWLAAGLVAAAVAAGSCMPPSWGAAAFLHPRRRAVKTDGVPAHREVMIPSGEVVLRGWLFPGRLPRRGLIIYLHGLGDNRLSGVGVAQRYGQLGWDVLTYDQRAHGESDGAACTYGYYEKHDIGRALDVLGANRAVVIGSSLGGSVALQAAAVEPRIAAVVAQSPFADLERIARERAPFFASEDNIRAAMRLAEREASFHIAGVSPLRDAPNIKVPVLLLHGQKDDVTRPAHSQALAAALPGPHELLLLPTADHDSVLKYEESWAAISRLLDQVPAG